MATGDHVTVTSTRWVPGCEDAIDVSRVALATDEQPSTTIRLSDFFWPIDGCHDFPLQRDSKNALTINLDHKFIKTISRVSAWWISKDPRGRRPCPNCRPCEVVMWNVLRRNVNKSQQTPSFLHVLIFFYVHRLIRLSIAWPLCTGCHCNVSGLAMCNISFIYD